LGRGVDVPVEVNWTVICVSPSALVGRHRIDAGYRRELALERRGHGRSHGLGAGAWQARGHLDGRKSTFGRSLTESCLYAMTPKIRRPAMSRVS